MTWNIGTTSKRHLSVKVLGGIAISASSSSEVCRLGARRRR